jgi:hypothetical protein
MRFMHVLRVLGMLPMLSFAEGLTVLLLDGQLPEFKLLCLSSDLRSAAPQLNSDLQLKHISMTFECIPCQQFTL